MSDKKDTNEKPNIPRRIPTQEDIKPKKPHKSIKDMTAEELAELW